MIQGIYKKVIAVTMRIKRNFFADNTLHYVIFCYSKKEIWLLFLTL